MSRYVSTNLIREINFSRENHLPQVTDLSCLCIIFDAESSARSKRRDSTGMERENGDFSVKGM